MRVSIVHRLCVLSIGAAALTASANARAQGAATAAQFPQNSGLADQGGAVIMMISQMDSDCNNTVYHNMRYVITHDSEFDGQEVDVGFSVGLHQDIACSYPLAYWADNRFDGVLWNYHEHTGLPSLNLWTRYLVVVQQSQSAWCAWDVWLDDIDGAGWMYLGTSTSNCPGDDRILRAGILTTSTDAAEYAQGWQWGWERLDSSGTWQNGWESPLATFQNSPAIIEPYTPAGCGQCEFEEDLNVPRSF